MTMNDNPTPPHDGCTCGPEGPGCEKMIYIGKLPDMDADESNLLADRAVETVGGQTYGSASDPLYHDLVQVTMNDENGDGVIRPDNAGESETITHDAAAESRDYKIDTSFLARNTEVTVLNEDGTTSTICTTVRVMQDDAGNTFIMPPPEGASREEIEAMTSKPIVSVEFPKDPDCYDLCTKSVFTDRSCFPCFGRGTLIETEFGPLPVEKLCPEMKVWTRDNGLKPLVWTGSRHLGALHLQAYPNLRPIRIRAGALGRNLPLRDLVVSPQHRILVRSKIAQRLFGTFEVLVAAKQLLQLDGIDIAEDLEEVDYFHLLFDQHEIIVSDGAETESLYTGPEALKSVGPAARDEILMLFPELRDRDFRTDPPRAARPLTSGRMARKLAVRHKQNRRELVS
ncbi:Hint domain-containing protein [uncultured Paracoccus sp.]|uniref:Hint domain-containing protein n=1 Tax=uncultured Paracoccus sp. TaxID=189685 RepID=UPI002602CF79|nr:Hint domain-containing protein [uncultured Paracoccus sp.]